MSRPSRRARRHRPLVVALYINAILLAAIVVAVLKPSGSPVMAATPMPQLAGGGGLYLMPAQFSTSMWGCYIMDIDKQTLCAYEYSPSGRQLKLLAARHFRHDRDLTSYNTSPAPEEIERLNNLGNNAIRGKEQPADSPGNTATPDSDVPGLRSTEEPAPDGRRDPGFGN